MSAKHALLGLLVHQPAYPYQLADRLQSRLGPAWAVNSGQLYQTIDRMERDGLIERVEGDAEGREDRHVFAITDSGVEEFERWLESSIGGIRLTRRPLLVKLTLAGPERMTDALAQIDAYELDCAARLKELSRMREASPAEGPRVRADHVLLRLNLSADIFQLEAELRWARHAREMMSWLLTREAIWPSAQERHSVASAHAPDGLRARRELFGKMAARRAVASSEEHGQDRES
jgi:DNA-binding PadR family transcriptional regulator